MILATTARWLVNGTKSLALAATAISESIRERFEEKTRSMMLPEIVSVSLREEVGDLGAGCSIGGVIGEGWTAVQVASEGPGGGSGLNEFGEFRPEVAGGGISRVPRGVDTEDAVDEVLLVASLQDYINSNYASAEDSGGYVHLLRDLDSFADAEYGTPLQIQIKLKSEEAQGRIKLRSQSDGVLTAASASRRKKSR
ncbi:hypothetical protein B0H10DRAFT_1951543 [Mycena sp. CBHHK59/15]|nr:hypothetical protein B0H10DRAFT_1951543 [Mycena sp. CBHHK59/15]